MNSEYEPDHAELARNGGELGNHSTLANPVAMGGLPQYRDLPRPFSGLEDALGNGLLEGFMHIVTIPSQIAILAIRSIGSHISNRT